MKSGRSTKDFVRVLGVFEIRKLNLKRSGGSPENDVGKLVLVAGISLRHFHKQLVCKMETGLKREKKDVQISKKIASNFKESKKNQAQMIWAL